MEDKGDKALNLIAKYRAMLSSEVSDPFLLLDDDHVFLRPASQVPLHTKGPLSVLCTEYRGSTHGLYLQTCHELLVANGLPTKNYQIHFPLLIQKPVLARAMEIAGDKRTVMGSLYGNLIDGPTVEVTRDFKLNRQKDFAALRDSPFVSLADGQWRVMAVRKWLMAQLPDPSPWESH